MNDILGNSLFFGVGISIGTYILGTIIKKKVNFFLFNPLLLAITMTIATLLVTGIEYSEYNNGAKYLSYLLTPATVALAIPLYEQVSVLKKNLPAILIGIASGVITSGFSIFAMALLFGLGHTQYVTLLPKSITTAIGMGVSEELGGIPSVTVACIVTTGIMGNVLAGGVLKLFCIKDPVAQGVAIGTASHAIGTARARELGDVQEAMSGLSIAVCGLITVVLASVFANLY